MTTTSVCWYYSVFSPVSRLTWYHCPAISLFFLILYFCCGCWWGDEPCGAGYSISPSTCSLASHSTTVVGMQVSDRGSEQASQICSNPRSDAFQSSFSSPYLKICAFFLWLKRCRLLPFAHAVNQVIMGGWQDTKLPYPFYLLSCGDFWKSWGCPTGLQDSGN